MRVGSLPLYWLAHSVLNSVTCCCRWRQYKLECLGEKCGDHGAVSLAFKFYEIHIGRRSVATQPRSEIF